MNHLNYATQNELWVNLTMFLCSVGFPSIKIFPSLLSGFDRKCANTDITFSKTLKHKGNLTLVDGNWGAWSAWSACSKTCKQGKCSRKRKCDSPAPQYGGKKCEGDSSDEEVCNANVPCPGNL